jgi:hypothetical protein
MISTITRCYLTSSKVSWPSATHSHLKKCTQYHLIKRGMCAVFSESCEPSSLTELPEVLNPPRIVFSDLQITKANEQFPRKLFAVNNIHLCLRYGLIRILGYLFPLCLFDTAIFEERIRGSDRLILLESCLAYFILILDCLIRPTRHGLYLRGVE